MHFSCAKAGATCRWDTNTTSDDQLLREVAEHLRTVHRVQHVTKTLQNFALKVAKS